MERIDTGSNFFRTENTQLQRYRSISVESENEAVDGSRRWGGGKSGGTERFTDLFSELFGVLRGGMSHACGPGEGIRTLVQNQDRYVRPCPDS